MRDDHRSSSALERAGQVVAASPRGVVSVAGAGGVPSWPGRIGAGGRRARSVRHLEESTVTALSRRRPRDGVARWQGPPRTRHGRRQRQRVGRRQTYRARSCSRGQRCVTTATSQPSAPISPVAPSTAIGSVAVHPYARHLLGSPILGRGIADRLRRDGQKQVILQGRVVQEVGLAAHQRGSRAIRPGLGRRLGGPSLGVRTGYPMQRRGKALGQRRGDGMVRGWRSARASTLTSPPG